ncbi:MAG: response regulator [candidate division Zixibacteria bacterium]|nr:response regulator [candidate division Zixibacteria bacterium]
MRNILIIDDTDSTYTYCREFLSNYFSFKYLPSGFDIEAYLKDNDIDLVLLDKNFRNTPDDKLIGPVSEKHNEGLRILGLIKKLKNSLPVIMITSYGDIISAEQAINLGAYDYIESDMLIRGETILKNKINNALEKADEDNSDLLDKFHALGMAGSSLLSIELFQNIEKAAGNDEPILLTGPTGAGKDKAARIIHERSARIQGEFINFALPERSSTMIESELFGIEKKAATGVDFHHGIFEAASGGTVLLNEIGELSLSIQTKLLRVIEEGIVYRIGGVKAIEFDCKMIFATNKNLAAMVKNGDFRKDLYYRINSNHIEIPSLDARRNDIPELIELMIDDYSNKRSIIRPEISDKAVDALKNRNWPGNIRELRNIIEGLIENCDGVITLGTIVNHGGNYDQLKDNYSVREPKSYLDGKKLTDLERESIEYHYNKFKGDIDKVAETTGISRSKIYERLKQYGIK